MRHLGPLPLFQRAVLKRPQRSLAAGEIMAEHTHSGPVEVGAPVDYAEHQRTFAGFVTMTKIGALATIAIVQSLTLFGIAAHGFWLGVLMIAADVRRHRRRAF